MPVSLLDVIVLGVMLLSGMLAMIRGFMREILSILGWITAAAATYYSYKTFIDRAKEFFKNDILATGALVGGTFLLTLIVVTIITSRISDMVIDSRIGALDRTLGFLFGLARGLLIIVVAFLFFAWLVPLTQRPDWVRDAKSLGVLEASGKWLEDHLPEELLNNISSKFKKRDDQQTDAAPLDMRPTGSTPVGGYAKSSRDGLKNLIDSPPVRSR